MGSCCSSAIAAGDSQQKGVSGGNSTSADDATTVVAEVKTVVAIAVVAVDVEVYNRRLSQTKHTAHKSSVDGRH